VAPVAVVVQRNPTEIAASLHERNGFGPAYGWAVWERYQRRLFEHAAGLSVVVVDYAALVADPAAGCAEISQFLEGAGLVTASAQATSEAAATLDARLRHHHRAPSESGRDASAEQVALAAVAAESTGAHDRLTTPSLGPETPGLQLAFDEHKRMSRYEERVDWLTQERDAFITEMESQRDYLTAELEKRSAEASAEIGELRAQGQEWEAKLLELYRRLPVRLYSWAKRRIRRA